MGIKAIAKRLGVARNTVRADAVPLWCFEPESEHGGGAFGHPGLLLRARASDSFESLAPVGDTDK